MIIRKGAIAAYANDYVVIPMNMADGILLCRGKGNKDWNYSCLLYTSAKDIANIQ